MQGSLDISSVLPYLCSFVRLKVKRFSHLRETQINSNSVACVRDCSVKPAAKRGLAA
nr:MAG TPA: hypothetical protein [Microviridae sp.]